MSPPYLLSPGNHRWCLLRIWPPRYEGRQVHSFLGVHRPWQDRSCSVVAFWAGGWGAGLGLPRLGHRSAFGTTVAAAHHAEEEEEQQSAPMRPFTNRTAPATAKKLTNQALACPSCFTTKRPSLFRASSQLSRLVSSWPEAMAFRRSLSMVPLVKSETASWAFLPLVVTPWEEPCLCWPRRLGAPGGLSRTGLVGLRWWSLPRWWIWLLPVAPALISGPFWARL